MNKFFKYLGVTLITIPISGYIVIAKIDLSTNPTINMVLVFWLVTFLIIWSLVIGVLLLDDGCKD